MNDELNEKYLELAKKTLNNVDIKEIMGVNLIIDNEGQGTANIAINLKISRELDNIKRPISPELSGYYGVD